MTDDLLTPDNELLDDLFIKPQKKKKILVLSDHPLAPSGVGIQARFLIEGLIKTGKYTFRCLGGAIKHQDYRTIKVNDDFLVKPVDGFGTHDMIRNLLITEKPDALLLFTDPRQFIWLWEIEDEIHQICPIAYWHVWDNDPFPAFNRPWYESTDYISCLSHKTYELVKPNFPDKTEYIPHAFPKNIYFELDEKQKKELSQQNFGARADWFKVLWVNRNAARKMPADLLDSWKLFLEKLEKKHGHRNAVLIMHTDPNDQEGPNLLSVAEMLGLQDHVWFSTDKLQFENMNILHNLVDTTINTAKNEGFGLSTLASLQVGRPIITLKTGGETRQVIDYRDGTELGVGLDPSKRSLVGSQIVPYIYEDFADQEETADALMKIFELSDDEKKELSKKCKEYVDHEFNYENMIEKWDKGLTKCIEGFQNGDYKTWTLQPLNPTIDTNMQSANATSDPGKIEQAQQRHAQVEASKTNKFVKQQNKNQTGKKKTKTPGKKKVSKKRKQTQKRK